MVSEQIRPAALTSAPGSTTRAVAGHLDQPEREALQACGPEIASEWWVTPQPLLPEGLYW